jgi:hypothetical protein
LCSFMFFYVLLCSFMFFYVLLCSFMFFYVLLCSFMFFYVLLCSFMFFYVLLCSFMFFLGADTGTHYVHLFRGKKKFATALLLVDAVLSKIPYPQCIVIFFSLPLLHLLIQIQESFHCRRLSQRERAILKEALGYLHRF